MPMKLFRITYRTEIFIRARDMGHARAIFEEADLGHPDLYDGGHPDEAGVAAPEEFVETVSAEEYPQDFLD